MSAPDLSDLTGRRVLILGLGRNQGGAGVARWAAERGAALRVTDLRDERALRPSLDALTDVEVEEYVLGGHREEDVEWADLVIRNPAVPREAPILEQARRLGKPVLMEMALFAMTTEATLVGITGTKGKTTATNVAYELIAASGTPAVMVGNMGIPALQYGALSPDTVAVAEISSFHVEGMHEARLSPPVAVFTNLLRDHLDRYATFEEYIEVKASMIDFQEPSHWAVVPWTCPHRDVIERRVRGRRAYFAAGGERPPGEHVVWSDGTAIEVAWEGRTQRLCAVDDLPHRGAHNVANVCAGVCAALLAGVSAEVAAERLPSLRPVENRLESVATVAGVQYVNDTTATTPDAAAAGTRSFPGRDLVLIAGGGEKGLDQAITADAAAERARAVVLLPGEATDRLVEELRARGLSNLAGPVASMAEAVEAASGLAREGTVVLLSPGATSFTLFHDEFDRGGQFRDAVRGLAAAAERAPEE
ncbi:MAG: UDP-N-acetylmuramoyl-L-alanine--D-glutamate ligase [Actinomycetota bacterium]|nr:UDP-N-acetylmuramoyl-L-alanine--D-glutamate ligase [Actinomycetota bacterium]